MKKTEMIKKNYEFKTVLAKGKFFIGKEIEIFLLKNNQKRNLLGIAVGTKNGKAFQRNRAKRIIRESYTKLENKLVELNNKYPNVQAYLEDEQIVDLSEKEREIVLKIIDLEDDLVILEIKESFKLGFKEAYIYFEEMGMLNI